VKIKIVFSEMSAHSISIAILRSIWLSIQVGFTLQDNYRTGRLGLELGNGARQESPKQHRRMSSQVLEVL
jgi:hypothetical protein